MHTPLSAAADDETRARHYELVTQSIYAVIEGEQDWVAVMATVCCELHHALEYAHWTGFYRHTRRGHLIVGPYQGGHGCLHIPFTRGVCGAAARTRATQLVPDVHAFPDHIACSSTTRSELVVPVLTPAGEVIAVLDLDSDLEAAFGEVDRRAIEALCAELGRRFAGEAEKIIG
jgi:L-methionine (R)-S-oxide reductase